MDPLEWLKSLFREPTRQEQVDKAIQPSVPNWLRELYKSPVADSLYQIAGVPNKLEGYNYTGPGTEYGYYNFGLQKYGGR